MQKILRFLKGGLRNVLIFIAVLSIGWVFVTYYSYIFADNVHGIIIGNERVTEASAIVVGGDKIGAQKGLGASAEMPANTMFSFAIAIKNEKGEIFTASSIDRQWAVAIKGMCAEAKFFPYPPWNFEKAGTYYGARLTKLYECPANLKEKPQE